MPKPASKQKLLYQQAWLKAHRQPQGLELHFKTRAGAFEARRHLYDAVREAKEAPDLQPDLYRAAEAIQIVWAGQTSLHMRHRDQNDATQGLEAALGLEIDEVQDPEMLESQRRMLERLSGKVKKEEPIPDRLVTGQEHQDNPFYGRRDPLKGDDK